MIIIFVYDEDRVEMYICICNALKEQEMAGAFRSGATCVSQVYKSLGCQPVCGKCVPYVRENLRSAAISGEQTL